VGVDGSVKLMQPLWKTAQKLLKKTKNRTTICSSYPTPEHISEENEKNISKRYILFK